MEKTNKCLVQFVCVGNSLTCDYSYNSPCKYFVEGSCTNKQAQLKALEDEGFKCES